MENQNLVLMTYPLPEFWIGSSLDGTRVLVGEITTRGIDSGLLPQLENASGIFCLLDDPLPAEIITQAPNLRVISSMAVGTDNIDLKTCTRLGIPVGHTPGVLTESTADLTILLLLAAARGLETASQDARQGRWASWNPTGWLGADLPGATAGIVGLGKIGAAVAQRLVPFGCRILFTNRTPRPNLAASLPAEQVSLDRLLSESDFVCLHVPLTPETQGMINKHALKLMKPGAILVNAARGPVVETDALLEALQTGIIRAAGLDVTDPEPLPPEHPLYRQPNCLITPHIGSATHNTRQRMAQIALDNLRAGLAGERLRHCANPEVYSHSRWNT